MTVVTMPDRSLLVHSPVEPTPALRAAVDALGEVAVVVAPNVYHHVYAGSFHAAYPKAKLVGPRGLVKKRRDLRLGAFLGDPGVLPEGIVPVHVPSMLDETVLFVPHLRTVVSADLAEHFVTVDHFPTRLYLKAGGVLGKTGVPLPLHAIFLDRKGARRAIDEILSFDFDRLMFAHGTFPDTGGKEILRGAYGWLRG